MAILLVCALAGIISELLTIAMPDKILGITDSNPEELLANKFYKALFVLSGFYLVVVVLLFASGIERFQTYAFVMLCMSLLGLIFKTHLKKYPSVFILESTISLIILLDIVRRIVKEFI